MATKSKSRRPTVRKTVAKKRPAVRKKIATRSTRAKPATLGGTAMRFAGVGSEAVLKATGRAWDEWLKVLDRAGAKDMPHKDIAALLSRKFSVPGWWSQMVTVGYEQARGLRLPNQKSNGFSATASKTVRIPLDKLYTAWTEPRQRSRWLPDAPVEVRRSTDGKSIRMTWTLGDSSVDVGFQAKGADKSLVAIEHSKLPDARSVAKQKMYWRDALERLKALLEPK